MPAPKGNSNASKEGRGRRVPLTLNFETIDGLLLAYFLETNRKLNLECEEDVKLFNRYINGLVKPLLKDKAKVARGETRAIIL